MQEFQEDKTFNLGLPTMEEKMNDDACELVEINAKIFKIDEYYIEDIIKNLK